MCLNILVKQTYTLSKGESKVKLEDIFERERLRIKNDLKQILESVFPSINKTPIIIRFDYKIHQFSFKVHRSRSKMRVEYGKLILMTTSKVETDLTYEGFLDSLKEPEDCLIKFSEQIAINTIFLEMVNKILSESGITVLKHHKTIYRKNN